VLRRCTFWSPTLRRSLQLVYSSAIVCVWLATACALRGMCAGPCSIPFAYRDKLRTHHTCITSFSFFSLVARCGLRLCKIALTFQFAWLMSVASLSCCTGLYRALTFPRRIDEVNEQGIYHWCRTSGMEVYFCMRVVGCPCGRSPCIPTLRRWPKCSIEWDGTCVAFPSVPGLRPLLSVAVLF
jgi:hypothetical protein